KERAAGLYAEDRVLPIRRSHENPEIKALYEHFLKAPGSPLAHQLLHTSYTPRDPYLGSSSKSYQHIAY
ncbi:MAG: iron hydrogenase small subunit, partial [Spirochaetales bacterium]